MKKLLEKNKGKIVLVDENFNHISYLKKALHDYDVTVVYSPFKLISSFFVEKPDLIIINAALSWFYSAGICEAMRHNPYLNDIPILFFNTSNTSAAPERICCYSQCFLVAAPSLEQCEIHKTVTNIIKGDYHGLEDISRGKKETD